MERNEPVIHDFIARAAGRLFNSAGDAVLAEFPSALAAVRCAMEIQESLRTRNLGYSARRQRRVRIGIAIGDVVYRDSDVSGDAVNIAAHLLGLAEPGSVCVSHSVYEQVVNKLSVPFRYIGQQLVKNISSPVHAYLIESWSKGTSADELQQPNEMGKSIAVKDRTLRRIAITLTAIAVLGFAAAASLFLARYLQSTAPRPPPVVAAQPDPSPQTAQPSAPSPRPSAQSRASLAGSERIALIVANTEYPDADQPLTLPRSDASSLAEELKRSGFQVELAENLTKQQLRDATDRFKKNIKPRMGALFYYGGYAIQSGRQNYMIPVNAQIWTERDVARDGISIESLLGDIMDQGTALKFVVLDASRRNPFERRFRNAAAGLGPITTPKNTLVISAAALGQVISEGSGKNSVFMTELLKEHRASAGNLEDLFSRARISISRATNGEQVPWVSSTLTESIVVDPAQGR